MNPKMDTITLNAVDAMDVLEDFSDKSAGKIFKAAVKYAVTGEIDDVGEAERVALKAFIREMNRRWERYQEKCEQLRKNGTKGGEFGHLGGRPKKNPEQAPQSPNGDIKPQITPNGVLETPKTPIQSQSQSQSQKENTPLTPQGGDAPAVRVVGEPASEETAPQTRMNAVPLSTAQPQAPPEKSQKPPPKTVRPKFVPPTAAEVEAYCRERGNGIDGQAFVDYYASKGWIVGKTPMRDWKAAVGTWEARRKRDEKPTTTPKGGDSGANNHKKFEW